MASLLLVLALYKAPEVGWWAVWLAAAFLVIGPVLVAWDVKHPPKATKRRQITYTVSITGGYLLVSVLSAAARGDKVPGSLSPLVFVFAVLIGLISWFAGRPRTPDPAAPGEETC
ncbi:hypothetical protein [Kocuria rosea]|uniref:Uncharacterized protein n=1 Tax=Kocuria rosea TaxID=1275 RepID=A0A4R5YN24_KOCRO|nr:hypothetical protein [Kocuria rosea]TDL46499.1 hypothetical protein E2R59_00290 [Kocuria rosea]